MAIYVILSPFAMVIENEFDKQYLGRQDKVIIIFILILILLILILISLGDQPMSCQVVIIVN